MVDEVDEDGKSRITYSGNHLPGRRMHTWRDTCQTGAQRSSFDIYEPHAVLTEHASDRAISQLAGALAHTNVAKKYAVVARN